jgi:ABC-type hemin transport system ATPase subunit
VALVGPTGAGKSSVIRLLCRLYDINSGAILLDGVDIRDLPQAELSRRMAVVLQDGFLFAGDVKSNITLGEDYSPGGGGRSGPGNQYSPPSLSSCPRATTQNCGSGARICPVDRSNS